MVEDKYDHKKVFGRKFVCKLDKNQNGKREAVFCHGDNHWDFYIFACIWVVLSLFPCRMELKLGWLCNYKKLLELKYKDSKNLGDIWSCICDFCMLTF